MAKVVSDSVNVGFQLRSIELLKGNLELPPQTNLKLESFAFNITLEDRPNPVNKLLFVVVSVDIMSENQDRLFGSIAVSCIYEIKDFDDVVKVNADGRVGMPKEFADMVHSLSISTTRGVMFSTFKGTFLHNAVLPIIDPRSLEETVKA